MRKLYTESLRRLTPAGVLLTLFFGSLSVILGLNSGSNTFVNIEELNYLLYLFPYAAGAGLAIVAFSFLNKRSASDLYLGLPYRRSTLFWGIMLSILTWGAITLGISLLMTALSLSMKNCLFLWSHIGVLFVYWFIAFSLVVGALTLGQCLSGQWFFGLSWGLVLLFMVRYILFIATLYLDSYLDSYVSGNLAWTYGGLLNPGINFTTGILSSLMDWLTGIGTNSIFFNLKGYAYSLLVAAVYMVLSTLAFCKRKGELSGSSASSLKIQHLLSILTGFVPTVLALYVYTEVGTSSIFMVLVVIGFLTFLGYELVASRSVKKTLKAILWYGVSLAAALVCLLGMELGGKLYKNAIPTSGEQIASVSFMTAPNLEYDNITDSQLAQMQQVELKDEEILNMVAEGINAFRSKEYSYRNYNYSSKVAVKLKNGMTMYLHCMVDAQLEKALSQREEYLAIASELPSSKDVVAVRLWNSHLDVEQSDQYTELYAQMLKEMEENSKTGEDIPMLLLRVYAKQGLQVYEDRVYVYRSQAPETAKKLVELSLAQKDDLLEIWQNKDLESVTIQDISPNEGGTMDLYSTWATEEVTQQDLIALLRQMPLAEGTEEHMLKVMVYGYWEGSAYTEYGIYCCDLTLPIYLAPTEEQYAAYQTIYALSKGDEEKAEELGYIEYTSEGVLYY